MKAVIFDLDGTISDSSQGIYNSINVALEKKLRNKINKNEVGKYIGPPLYSSFSKILKTDDKSLIEEAVGFFRKDYRNKGYKSNVLYEGIYEVIKELSYGYKLFIATTKKKDMAEKVLRMFDLFDFFTEVYGGASKISKTQMIDSIMIKYGFYKNEIIMVGDTFFDIEGAKLSGIASIGVEWGFGNFEEISKADFIAKTPKDILKIIKKL